MLRFCLARVRNRGHGLGNELVPWARAFLASQVLNARLLPPAFGLNRRAYWRDFGTAPDDWLYNRAIERALPRIEFTEADYLAYGGDDVVAALRGFAAARGLYRRRMYVLVTEGLWGGFYHVQAARDFMRSMLYRSRYAARNLLRLRERLDPDRIRIGMHVRLGDFRAPAAGADYTGAANLSLPLDWFRRVALSLMGALGDRLQFLLVSDGTREQLAPLLDAVPCVITADLPHGDCSDVLALADCDLLVCSASTYSHLAAFLSDSPYVWFAPNLRRHPEGCVSLGASDADLARSDSPRQRALQSFVSRGATAAPEGWPTRAFPVGLEGVVPDPLLALLVERQGYRHWSSDLTRSGVVPAT